MPALIYMDTIFSVCAYEYTILLTRGSNESTPTKETRETAVINADRIPTT